MKGTVEVGLKDIKNFYFTIGSEKERRFFSYFITVGIITNEFAIQYFLLFYFFILRRLNCSSAFRVIAPTALSRGPGNRKA